MLNKVILTALAAFGLATAVQAAADKPNVLMIVVDDLSGATISHPSWGRHHPSVITPNLNRLSTEGVAFTQAYSNWPSCAPARQAFMSGMLPEKSGYRFYGDVRETDGRNRSAVYMPEHFRNNGYTSIRLSKIFHLGREVPQIWDISEEPFGPNRDRIVQQTSELQTLGFADNVIRSERFELMDGEKSTIAELAATDENGVAITEDKLVDGITAQRAIALLSDLASPGGTLDASQKPFFMAVGFRRPHLPFQAPTKYFGMYRWGAGDTNVTNPATAQIVLPPQNSLFNGPGNPDLAGGNQPEDTQYRKSLEGYYACLTMVDELIGDILNHLDTTGLANDTIVVLFGDHGYGLGEHNRYFSKGTPDNVGFNTPLIVRLPGGQGRANQAEGKAVTLVDVYPTLIELAGLPKPETPLDGKSFAPLLFNADSNWNERAVGFLGDNNDETLPLKRFIWSDGYKYYEEDGRGPSELYAVGAGDRFEFNNLIKVASYNSIEASLKAKMQTIMDESIQNIAPEVIEQPETKVVAVGENTMFSVRTFVDRPITRAQWYKDGVAIPGATTLTLVLNNVTTANAGDYSCTIWNEIGRTFSYRAELRVEATASTLFDWMIDDPDPAWIIDGVNGTFFSNIEQGTSKFGGSMVGTYYSNRDGNAYVRPGLPYGEYEIFNYNPSWTNATTSATYHVEHFTGSTAVPINQQSAVGWVSLGTYTLSHSSEVRINTLTGDGKFLALDGMRFVRKTAPANAKPVANGEGARTVAAGGTLRVNVLANDTDANGDTLQVFHVSGGFRGNVTVDGGSIVYVPHASVSSGSDTIHYQVSDGKALSNPASFTVTIGSAVNVPPVAAAGADIAVTDTDGSGSETVSLSGSASTDSDGSITSYAWSWTGGSATGVTASASFPVGVTTVTLTVTDNAGAQSTDTLQVTVSAAPVVGSLTLTQVGANVVLTWPAYTGTGNLTNYRVFRGTSGPALNWWVTTTTYTDANAPLGLQTYRVVAYDNRSAAVGGKKDLQTWTGTITVTSGTPVNQAPVASAGTDRSVTDTDNSGSETVSLDGSASTDSDGSISSYAWSWTGGSATGVTASASFPVGVTTVTLTVTDDDGAQATDTLDVTVQAGPPPVNGPVREAEAYAATSSASPWEIRNDDPGARGSGYVVVPSSVASNLTGSMAATGYLDYTFTTTQAGPINVAIRALVPSVRPTLSDSIFIDILGDDLPAFEWKGGLDNAGVWTWYTWFTGKPSSLPAGTYTLRIGRRESGLMIDQIAISSSALGTLP
jgi:arylsulfatase A-like enzyme